MKFGCSEFLSSLSAILTVALFWFAIMLSYYHCYKSEKLRKLIFMSSGDLEDVFVFDELCELSILYTCCRDRWSQVKYYGWYLKSEGALRLFLEIDLVKSCLLWLAFVYASISHCLFPVHLFQFLFFFVLWKSVSKSEKYFSITSVWRYANKIVQNYARVSILGQK